MLKRQTEVKGTVSGSYNDYDCCLIQVEQLSETTGEESILLTASVSDGSLSHLGSESGRSFLEGHEAIKSQFLGHVLKSK